MVVVMVHLWRLVAVMKHDTKHSAGHTEGDPHRGQTHLLKLWITVLSTHREPERLHTAFTTRTRAEWQRAGCQYQSRHLHGGGALGGGPVPELAVAVVAPALHRAVRQQGTRVRMTQSDARRRRDA